jgi:class 3 adenylate cyclase
MISSSEPRDGLFLFCDIRGFSAWMTKYQHEAPELLDMFYAAAFASIGARREQEYNRRVAKLLGDGFLAVYEYDSRRPGSLPETVKQLVANITLFRIDFYRKLHASTIHSRSTLKCGFGLSYGKAIRIGIPGYPLDYVSDRINFASRLVGVALKNEVVFEEDLWDYVDPADVLNKRKEERELKKMGKTPVGIFDADS